MHPDVTPELLATIFDINEGFATTHTVAGVSGIVCIVGDRTTGHSQLDGQWVTMFDVMTKKADVVSPEKRKKLAFDGVTYTVENVKDDGAVLTITLSLAREGAVLNQV
jgi:hypothetical protein